MVETCEMAKFHHSLTLKMGKFALKVVHDTVLKEKETADCELKR